MLHCHSKVGTTVSKVPLYYKPTYLKMRSRRVWENFLEIFYCLSGLRMENSSLKSTPLLNFLLHLYQAMKTRRHMPFISSTVSGWFLISTSIIWMLQIGPTPPPPPPPQQSRAVQNCGTIKVNWRFYIPLCFSLPPRYPLPQNWI